MIILLIDFLIENHNKMSKYSSKPFECSGEKIKKIYATKNYVKNSTCVDRSNLVTKSDLASFINSR